MGVGIRCPPSENIRRQNWQITYRCNKISYYKHILTQKRFDIKCLFTLFTTLILFAHLLWRFLSFSNLIFKLNSCIIFWVFLYTFFAFANQLSRVPTTGRNLSAGPAADGVYANSLALHQWDKSPSCDKWGHKKGCNPEHPFQQSTRRQYKQRDKKPKRRFL